jgi:Kef-type K+ transport system membrane component KefB
MAVATPVAHGDGYGVLGALVMAIGYVALMLFVARPVLARIWPARIGSRADEASQPGRFAAVLVLLLASGLAAHLAGLTVIVGGFLAGFVLPVCGAMQRTLQKRLADLTRIMLLPVFLACSGLQTDLTAVPAVAFGGLVLLFAGGTVTKWGGGALLARASGLSWPESNVLGILMNCPGVIVLVVALVGLHAGVITTAMQAGVVLVAVVCTALTDPLLRLFLPRLPVVSRDPPPALQTTDV